MAKTKKLKFVLYKLQSFGNGYINPNGLKNGTIWENADSPADIIFVCEVDANEIKDMDGVLEVISKAKYNKHFKNQKQNLIKQFKKKCFIKFTDAHFIEALREKELGKAKKWEQYLLRVNTIKTLKEIPQMDMLEFDDILND